MPKVAEQGLQAKLQKLSGSQPSIESVTEYCLFYYEDAPRVVAIWQQELQKARPERKLALVWVANHILLTAHKAKGQAAMQAYQAAFSNAMPKAVAHCAQQADDKLLKGVGRTVSVWEERKVFSSKLIKQLKDGLSGAGATRSAAAAAGGALPSASSRGANGAPHSSSSSAQLQHLGPVGEWLTSVHRSKLTTSEEQQKFSSSFTPDMLTTGKLPEVSGASTRLAALSAALAAEKAARAALVAAMQAEVAEQVSSIQALQQRIEAAQGQQSALEGRMGQLTQEMSRAVAGLAGLGNLLQAPSQANGGDADPDLAALLQSEQHEQQQQQQQAGVLGGSPQAPAAEPLGSPEAPDMELEGEDYLSGYPPPAAAAAAGGGGQHADPAAQAGQQQLLATLQGLPDQYQQHMQDLLASGLFSGAGGAPGPGAGGALAAAAAPMLPLGAQPPIGGGFPGAAPMAPAAVAAGLAQFGGVAAAGGMQGQYLGALPGQQGLPAGAPAADEEDEPYDPADE